MLIRQVSTGCNTTSSTQLPKYQNCICSVFSSDILQQQKTSSKLMSSSHNSNYFLNFLSNLDDKPSWKSLFLPTAGAKSQNTHARKEVCPDLLNMVLVCYISTKKKLSIMLLYSERTRG